ncbi:hypothetical protein L2E82_43756 [Cichorium intybus]|uniref:Uncharacterized protein n=1 Tax=Cichorium intybus TaxID=13427 RepID=A0ACB8ZN66_CICIN|nr:hypothetical protein L2E82_43756 [Cichorium intybus]
MFELTRYVGFSLDLLFSFFLMQPFQTKDCSNGDTPNVSPIAGRLFVLVGAGGTGRALAFGAKSKGARVVIFDRNFERAESLARPVSGEALPNEQLDAFWPENGMVLANCSAIGMEPDVHLTAVSKENLRSYDLVFDAVYTPRNTWLLQEAVEVGVTVVSGVEMFIRRAVGHGDPSAEKKPGVVWSIDLHTKFVASVNQLGIESKYFLKAVPKRNLDLMNVDGIIRENVASHLQVSSNGWAEGECQGKAGWFTLDYVECRENFSNSFAAK